MTKEFRYSGFSSPNGTIVPDDVFDVIAPELTEAELRVLLYVVRRTFGFKKNADAISVSQMVNGITTRDGRVLDRGTGMSKSAVWRGAKGLVEKGILLKEETRSENGEYETNVFSLHFASESEMLEKEMAKSENQGVSLQKSNPISPKELPPLSKRDTVSLQESTQQTVLQQTDLSVSNIRKRSHADFSVDNSTTQATKTHRNGSVEEGSQVPTTTTATSVSLADGEASPVKAWGMQAIGEILRKKGRGRPSKQESEERTMIMAFIGDFAREFQDQAQLKSSVSRAFNIYKDSGLSPVIFQDRMYQARIRTKERRAAIKGSRMAYFFACLEQEAGLREAPERGGSGTRQVRNG